MALQWIPMKKSLFVVVLIGLVSLGGVGVAGASATTPTTPTTTTATAAGHPGSTGRPVNCSGVETSLAGMRHRQASLATKVARLRSADALAVKAGKSHRALVDHRYLTTWQRVEAHKIDARFLRREAKLAALLAGHCPGAFSSAQGTTSA